MPTPPIVEISNLTHITGGKSILSDVSWQVRSGEHWALLGPNGAGKTTLLKIICGYLWPNGGGRVLRDGEQHVNLPQLRRQIGWVTSQLTTQIPSEELAGDTVLSGRFAQIGLRRFPGFEPSDDDEAALRDTLARLGCAHLTERTFGTLSQGEQQKVLIGRAWMARLRLLILDEPCAGLDPAARESLLEGIQNLAQDPEAPSILLVTHHVEEIMPALTMTLALRDGRVITRGPTAEAIDAALIEQLYGRPVRQLSQHGGRYWLNW
jgi:iron complex transport system ATP-binding protein